MFRRFAMGVLATLFAVESTAVAQTTAFSDSMVQGPELHAPSRGSVTGQYANVAFGPGDVSRGSFSLPLPIAVPDERGGVQVSPFPSYSPEAGTSEWGLGWQSTSLQIVRTRMLADLDYATDDLTGPWGRMIKGTDGNWYPDGLRSNVRVVVSGTMLIAYTPDGSTWTFGGSNVVTTPGGTYAWCLDSVVDVLGRTTSYTYTTNASGRRFLTDVLYGGPGSLPAYDVHLDYENTSVALTDYRSGAPLVLDRRVHQITAGTFTADGAQTTRWSYVLGYTQDAPGPSFYLTSLQQTFASGQQPPALTYTYGTSSAYLAKAAVARATKLDSLVPTYGADVIQPNRSSSFDADDDGRPDLEFSYDNRVLVQTDTGFNVQTLPATDVTTDPVCRHSAYSNNAPRLIARMRVSDATYSVLGAVAGVGTTSLAICNQAGQAAYQAGATGSWVSGALTKLADLNRDQQPDLVNIAAGSYSVLPNTSTPAAYSFGAPIHGVLSPVVNADSLWVHDFNGDGIPDLVGRAGSSFFVWPGKGKYAYDTGHAFNVVGTSGLPIPLTGYTVTFLDANGDGLADVLLQQSASLSLFLNNGTQLTQVAVPAFATVSWTSGRPVALDLNGGGNPSISFIAASKGYAIDLAAPPVGLLSSANDGKGTVLSFTYAPAPAVSGQRARHVLLASLGVASTGYDPVTYSYTYTLPAIHSLGHFLVGFDQVSRRGPLETQIDTFLNGDDFAGLPSTSEQLDDLEPSVSRIAITTYADVKSSFGINWKRKLTEAKGWETTSAQSPTSMLQQTSYTAYANDVCPASVTSTSSAGTLATQTTYGTPPAFTHALACMPSGLTMVGTHSDSSLDFRHQAAIARNAAGQLTTLTLYDRAGKALTAQSVTYNTNGLVATATNTGKGTSTFSYVSGTTMLQSTTAPNGVVSSVTSRDPNTDALLALTANHGATSYVQSFAYDGLERLSGTWNNLGGATATQPDQAFTYRYASGTTPALVETATLLDAVAKTHAKSAEIDSAVGEALATAHLIPQGWAFDDVARTTRASRTATRFTKPATANDIAALDVTNLYADGAFASSTQSSAFGLPVHQVNVVESGVQQDIVTALALPSALSRSDVENGQQTTATTVDASQRVTAVVDAAGAKTTYSYDAIGRVRRVHLADGAVHSVDYDDDGRPSRVDRSGVASITYRYDPTSGMLAERDFYGAAGNAHAGTVMRNATYAYDAAGRITTETDQEGLTGTSQTFTFYYDGATPSAPTARTALGFLTGIAGKSYTKTLTHRADGSSLSSVITFPGWRQVQTDLAYAADGFVAGRTVTVRDGAGTQLLQDKDVAVRDAYGRSSSTQRDGFPFGAFAYDANGLPSSMTLAAPYAHGEVATLTYDAVTRGKLATTLKGPAWSSSVSQHTTNRGLVGSETFAIGSLTRTRSYGYSAQKFVTQSTDADSTYAYAYDATGLPTNITSTLAGSTDARAFKRAGAVLTAGTHHHSFDDLGRVIERDDVDITYGPNGQISHAETTAAAWDYLYDEAGQRVAKLEGGKFVAAYLDDGSYLDGSGRTVPISFAGTVVGVLVEPTSAGAKKAFQLTVTDTRGTALADANGTARLPSPFGDRATHPDVAAAIDYATKGWDADLGVVRMGVRDYDPALSRWLQPDPLFLESVEKSAANPVAANLYAYSRNAPTVFQDQSGTQEAPSAQHYIDWRNKEIAAGHTAQVAQMDNFRIVGAGAGMTFAAGMAFECEAGLGIWAYNVLSRASAVVRAGVALVTGAQASPAVQQEETAVVQTVAETAPAVESTVQVEGEAATKAIQQYWPPNNGFLGPTTQTKIQPGTVIDRFGGSDLSRFFSPSGTPLEARSLPADTAAQALRSFRVLQPLDAESGAIAPAFGQLGMGVQFRTALTLKEMLDKGMLEEVH